MNVEDFLGRYPRLKKGKSVQKDLYHLKEFNELRLKKHEVPSIRYKNKLYHKYQILIQRFLSPYTLFPALLGFHEVGVGKTRSAILVAELNRLQFKRPPLVLVGNDLLVNNFIKEVGEINDNFGIEKSKYTKTAEKEFKELKKIVKIPDARKERKKEVKGGLYEIDTFGSFTTYIDKKGPEFIKKNYSNRVIIVDEAHNLRIIKTDKKKKETTKKIYEGMKMLFENVENCKVLFLTGTPVWDNYKEITELMNLLTKEKIPVPIFKDDKIINEKEFAEKLKGKVSYVRGEQPNIVREYQGEIVPPLKKTKVVTDEMSDEQCEAVEEAEKRDKTDKKGAGFRKYAIASSNFSYSKKGKHYYGTEITPEMKKKITKKKLKMYSSKFYEIIQKIEEAKGPVFVYMREVEGSGAKLFSQMLELYGFSEAKAGSIFGKKKKRYILVTSKTAHAKELINASNKPENVDGDYIKVVVGSKKISEGITLKNIREIHVVSPYWNLSGPEQVIGRGVRYKAHDEILKKYGIDVSTVKIFFHVATCKGKLTPDLDIYAKAENKDIKTRAIYNVLKRVAVDCPLNYERNYNPLDVDYSRECDYQLCRYKCSDFNASDKVDMKIKDTNYNVYYSENEINDIKIELEKMFKLKNLLTLKEITNKIKKDEVLIVSALKIIKDTQLPIYDKNGIVSYLKQLGNAYFLNKTDAIPKKIYGFYLNNTILKRDVTLSDIIDDIRVSSDKKYILRLCQKTDVSKVLDKLNHPTKVITFETAFELVKDNRGNKNAKDIVDNMKSFYYEVNGKDVAELVKKHVKAKLEKGQKDISKFRKTILFLEPSADFTKLDKSIQTTQHLTKENRIEPIKLINSLVRDYKNKMYTVHILGEETPETEHKRTIKATGKTKFYSDDVPLGRRWRYFPDIEVEEAFIDAIKDIEVFAKNIYFKANPYGYAGLIDKDTKTFMLIKGKGEGRACKTITKPVVNKIIEEIKTKHGGLPIDNIEKFMKKRKLYGDDIVSNPYGYFLTEQKGLYDIEFGKYVDVDANVKRNIKNKWRSLGKILEGEGCDAIYDFLKENKLVWEK